MVVGMGVRAMVVAVVVQEGMTGGETMGRLMKAAVAAATMKIELVTEVADGMEDWELGLTMYWTGLSRMMSMKGIFKSTSGESRDRVKGL